MRAAAGRALLAALAVLALGLFLANLARPLANPDEGRYSEISREMAASGDWVTPRLNGIKYFEKPPLQYWASASSFKLFGEGEAAARLYVVLCGLATLLLVLYTAGALGGPMAGAAAAAVLASSPYFMALAGVVTLDMGLTCWTTLTFCAYVLAERPLVEAAARRRWMLLAWAGMALAVLSKGLVGIVFPVAALGLHCLARRDFSPLARMEWTFGLVVFLALAAPWFIAVSFANPEFPEFFFVQEHFQRFLTTSHRRGEPWWYFLPILALGFLPWVFALPSAVAHAWRVPAAPRVVAPLRFATLWSAFILVFFSASGSKLPAYLLPAFPPLAVVLGRYLADAPTGRLAKQVAPTVLLSAVLVAVAWHMPQTAREPWTRELYAQVRPWAVAAAVALMLAGATTAYALWRGRRGIALALVAIGTTLAVGFGLEAHEAMSPRQSGKAVALKLAEHLRPQTRLYSVRYYEQTVPFYARRLLTLVDYLDEFETGLKSHRGSSIPRLADFPDQWLAPGEALAIMNPETYMALRAQALPMQLLHEDPRRILVRKP